MLGNFPVYANIPVVDLERARKFYEGTLGLKVESEGMGGVTLYTAGNGTKLMTYQRGATKADHTVASFVVDDIEKSIEDLVAKGIKFEQYDFGNGIKTDEKGIMTMGPAKAAWFKDTEGNILALNNKM